MSRKGPFWRATIVCVFLVWKPAASEEILAPDAWKEPVSVSADRMEGGLTKVSGAILIPAGKEVVWAVLTDYDHLSEFVTRMDSSELLADSGGVKIIFQKGTGKFLFFRKHVAVTLRVEEFFPDSILFSLIKGPFKIYHGRWLLRENVSRGGTDLQCSVTARPDFFVPGFIYRRIIRGEFKETLIAVRREAGRRV